MEQELAYSFHLGSDKNKSKVAKKTAKGNVSGTTSLSNNAIPDDNETIVKFENGERSEIVVKPVRFSEEDSK